LNFSWQSLLNQALKNHLVTNSSRPKIAIIGIGNEFNGDDGTGVLIVRKIKQALSKSNDLLIIEGSITPENYSAPIRRFNPDWIWFIDSADMNCSPGEMKIIRLEDIDGVTAFSHGLPLSTFGKYLQNETGASINIFGIQPEKIDSFTEMSEELKRSVKKISKELISWLKNNIINQS